MKTLTSLRLSFLPLLLLPLLACAQEKPSFTIQKPFGRSTYGDRPLRRMAYQELKSILLVTGDDEIVRNVRKIGAKRAVSGFFSYMGGFSIGCGAVLVAKEEDLGMPLVLGGAGAVIVSALIGSGSKGLLKRSMLRYNDLLSGATFVPGTTSINGHTGIGGTLTLTF